MVQYQLDREGKTTCVVFNRNNQNINFGYRKYVLVMENRPNCIMCLYLIRYKNCLFQRVQHMVEILSCRKPLGSNIPHIRCLMREVLEMHKQQSQNCTNSYQSGGSCAYQVKIHSCFKRFSISCEILYNHKQLRGAYTMCFPLSDAVYSSEIFLQYLTNLILY